MKKYVRFVVFSLVAGTASLAVSCADKTSDPQASVQMATLSGQVAPASAVLSVTATDASGKAVRATPTSTGAYSFAGLAVGTYTITLEAAPGYTAPAPLTATLVAAGTTVPTTTLALSPASASYQVNGTAVTAPFFTSLIMTGDRMLMMATSPGGGTGHTIAMFLKGGTPTVGTLSLTTADNSARYTGPDYVMYASDYGNGTPMSGTLTVTAVNTTARKFSGTFTFVGIGVNTTSTSPATKNITAGVFTNAPY